MLEEAVVESTRIPLGRRRRDHQHEDGWREHHPHRQRFRSAASTTSAHRALHGQVVVQSSHGLMT
jgi:hypothetical protein